MVDEVLTNTIGLIVGFGVAQTLGDFAESKIKPGVVMTSTSQDKMTAEVANNGSKVALAYGVYTAGKTSSFAKSAVVGSVLSTIFDVYWRYKHEGVPYSGYKTVPIGGSISLISDTDSLEDIIAKGRILEEI